jgi:hypothetical protein
VSGNTDGLSEMIAAAFAGLFGFVAGAMIAGSWVDVSWQKSAVKHGAAEYNQTSGKWQWKAEETD